MIPKIGRGQKVGGLMVYLLGKGDHNEHRDRHLIAGSPTVMREMWLAHFDDLSAETTRASRDLALAIAHEIDIPRKLYGTQVRMKAKAAAGGRGKGVDVVERPGRGEEAVMRDAPVWHCVLSLPPGETLSDEKWSEVVNDFMTEMGFTATSDAKRAQARWAAVRHGKSGENGDKQDHIHIAASLVREDGGRVNLYDFGPGKAKGDWKRAQEVCNLLEHRHGLQVLASREQGGALSGDSRAEYERTSSGRTPESERDRLRRLVRIAAVGAESESEFVTALRESGVSVAPRWAAGGQSEVTGYKVRLRRDGVEAGPWVGGGTLAKDLTLSALREQQWSDSPEARETALAAWKGERGEQRARPKPGGVGRSREEMWQQAAVDFADWQRVLREVPREQHGRWAWLAGQASAVFSAWSEQLEGEQPGPLAAAAKELTRSAQTQSARHRYRPTAQDRGLGDLTRLLISAGPIGSGVRLPSQDRHHDRDEAASITAALLALLLILLLAVIAAIREIARAHQARGELARGIAVRAIETEHLAPLERQWRHTLTQQGYDIDTDLRAVQAAVAARSAASRPESAPETESAPRESDDATTSPSEVSPITRRRIAAAAAPLTPPSATPPATPTAGEQEPRRRYYTELDPQERSLARLVAVTNAQFARKDLQPASMTDDELARVLAHLRTEVHLLREELAERAQQGPKVRQVHEDTAVLTRKAALIETALRAEEKAQELQRRHDERDRELARLRDRLEDTPRRKFLVRQQLQGEITAAEAALAELEPERAEAVQDAEDAARATSSPRSEWSGIQYEATPRQRDVRLAQAERHDAAELAEDEIHLRRLERDLQRAETEDTRRAALPAAEREADRLRREQQRDAQRRRRSTPQQGPAGKPYPGYTPPTPDRDPDHGPER